MLINNYWKQNRLKCHNNKIYKRHRDAGIAKLINSYIKLHYIKKNECTGQLSNNKRPERPRKTIKEFFA